MTRDLRSGVEGWRPIESAPKRTLMVAADHVREYLAIGCINAYGEFEEADKTGSPRGTGFYPTHWMPLPQLPVDRREDQGSARASRDARPSASPDSGNVAGGDR